MRVFEIARHIAVVAFPAGEFVERHGHIDLAPEVRSSVLAVSAATIDRALRPVRVNGATGSTRLAKGIQGGRQPRWNPHSRFYRTKTYPVRKCRGFFSATTDCIRAAARRCVGGAQLLSSWGVIRGFTTDKAAACLLNTRLQSASRSVASTMRPLLLLDSSAAKMNRTPRAPSSTVGNRAAVAGSGVLLCRAQMASAISQ